MWFRARTASLLPRARAAWRYHAQYNASTSASTAVAAGGPTLEGAEEADYVILGAGSAGCVLANRLSEDAGSSVLLIEAGPGDRGRWDSWKIHMPAALTYNLADDRYNWAFVTEPQPGLGGRRLPWPRGRVLGGSSSLNAMVYIRGHAFDYDRWAREEGAVGWAYADCLPYFTRAEGHASLPASAYVGVDGPLRVSRHNAPHPLFDAFVAAAQEAGYPRTNDLNGYQQEGFGPMDMTIDPSTGHRCSAATAYLHPVLHRPNLTVRTSELVARVIFDADAACSSADAACSSADAAAAGAAGDAEPRAVGVELISNVSPATFGDAALHGRGPGDISGTLPRRAVRARKEVILCSGAIGSPHTLLLSGVGDRRELGAMGIGCHAHVPGVGRNLQDHLDLYVQVACKTRDTLYNYTWGSPHRMVATGAEWFARGTGPAASNHLEAGGFIRTSPGRRHPDLQYHFLPGALTGQLTPGKTHAFQAHASTMRPASRGTVRLGGADPAASPVVDPRYLSEEEDIVDLRQAVRLTNEIFAQPALRPFLGAPLSPAAGVADNDDELDDWVRAHTESAYHPSCTCKMGAASDPLAVVDAQGRVRGARGLRVVDASIMPSVVSGNLNAPTIMIAEKLSDVIRGRDPLPPADVPVYVPGGWETRQR